MSSILPKNERKQSLKSLIAVLKMSTTPKLNLMFSPTNFEIQVKHCIKYGYVVCTLADSGCFKKFLYQGGVKSTVSWVFKDLKFKISEGSDPNWCFPDSAQLAVSV